jgi:hypothetical protein
MAHLGWDLFITEPDSAAKDPIRHCHVCQERMKVRQDIMGPRNWRENVAGVKTQHDEWFCVNSEEDWHRQALAILLESEKTPSAVIQNMLKQEVEQILKNRTATKVVFI